MTATLLVLATGCTDEYASPRDDSGPGFPGVCRPTGALTLSTIGGTTMVSGSTAGLSHSGALCGQGAPGPDDAWTLIVPSLGQVTLAIERTESASVLHVQSSCSGGMEFGCDDDVDGMVGTGLTLTLSPGTYYVIVDSRYGDSFGPYVLRLTNVSVGP